MTAPPHGVGSLVGGDDAGPTASRDGTSGKVLGVLSDAQDLVESPAHREFTDVAVALCRLLTKFEHVAQHRHSTGVRITVGTSGEDVADGTQCGCIESGLAL